MPRRMTILTALTLACSACYPGPLPPAPELGDLGGWLVSGDSAAASSEFPASAWADDLFGIWTVTPDDLDARLAALAARLAVDGQPLAARLRAALGTATGRLLFGHQVDRTARMERARSVERALRGWIDEHFTQSSGQYDVRSECRDFAAEIKTLAAQATSEMAALQPRLSELSRQLHSQSLVGAALQEWLADAQALRTLYLTTIRPRVRPDPVRASCARWLTADDAGHLIIPAVARTAAQAALSAQHAQVARLTRLVQRTSALAARIDPADQTRCALQHALADPLFIVILAQQLRTSAPHLSANELDTQLVAELQRSVDQLASGGNAAQVRQLQALLAAYGRARWTMDAAQASARRLAALLAARDSLAQGWRSALQSDFSAVAALTTYEYVPADAVGVLDTQTPLGTGLIHPTGTTVDVNPHCAAELERFVAELRAAGAGQQMLADRLRAWADELADPELAEIFRGPAGVCIVVDALRSVLVNQQQDGLAAWVDTHLALTNDSLAPRATETTALAALLDQIEAAASMLATDTAACAVDLAAVPFWSGAARLLRSSSFYTKRTALAEHIYFVEYDDHEAARLFLTFEWPAYRSTDAQSFERLLLEQQAEVARLAGVHRRLVLVINKMPEWLSRSDNRTACEATWLKLHACGPRDDAQWRSLVQSAARFFRQFEVERYYEIWNEPDGQYWQDTPQEYCELYAQTARAIREVDPEAKIGGPAVNRWQGTLRSAPDTPPLVLGLLRYAKAHALPLDFISWHQYSGDPTQIGAAADAVRDAVRTLGVTPAPELYLSEWGNALRDADESPALFAEHLAAMITARVDFQTAVWEDIEAQADASGYAPYGLITQQGRRKPEYFAYRFADRLSRQAEAAGVLRFPDGMTRAIIGQDGENTYDVLVWRIGPSAPLAAAMDTLKRAGLKDADLRAYGSAKSLERAVRAGRAAQRSQQTAFEAACKAYTARSAQPQVLRLTFSGATQVTPVLGQAVSRILQPKRVFAEGGNLYCELSPYELVWLRVRIH